MLVVSVWILSTHPLYVMAKSSCALECAYLILSFSSFRATSGVLAFGLVLLYMVSYLNNCFHDEGPDFSNQIINSLSAGLVPPFLCPSPFLTSALIPVSSQGHLVAQNERRRSIFWARVNRTTCGAPTGGNLSALLFLSRSCCTDKVAAWDEPWTVLGRACSNAPAELRAWWIICLVISLVMLNWMPLFKPNKSKPWLFSCFGLRLVFSLQIAFLSPLKSLS